MTKPTRMRRPSGKRRGVAAIGAVGLTMTGVALALLVGVAKPAQAATGSVPAPDAAEAWYSSAPAVPCPIPVACSPSPITPYPKDTLHVGVAGGKETARTYLVPDLGVVPPGATITAALMTLPLARDAQAGGLRPDVAIMKACLVTEPVKDAIAGSSETPPKIDDKVCVPAVYSAVDLRFTVDLAAFIANWSGGIPRNGIALVPELAKAGPTTVWHVAFNGRKRADTLHISSLLSYTTPDDTFGPPPGQDFTPDVILPPLGSGPPITGGIGPLPVPAPQTTPTVATPPAQQASVTVPARFQYPAAFLLPLAFFAAGVFFFRLFTADPTPVGVRA